MTIKALSIRQPWAWLIVNGIKDVENRSWNTQHRGPLLIHAAKTMTAADYASAQDLAESLGIEIPPRNGFKLGGIIGKVNLVDCVREHNSPWFFGPFGFVLENAEVMKFIPLRGQLGLFTVVYK